ncbi:MAG: homoserine dehydrogenase [Actinomycetota bacterium]|nr:homoserine dehydrogenase [Actinomycetota bacterium]
MTTTPVRVGVLGCSNVGAALVQLITDNAAEIADRTGVHLEVAKVAVKDPTKERNVKLADGVLTGDAKAVVADPDIDVIVEVMGGIEPARTFILDALNAGKPVVSANKELLANVGPELFQAAVANKVDLLFEASVGGGIPLIRALRESLAGDKVNRMMGIVNGTTNYILTKMSEAGASYGDALAEAQALGFAELDPTADVEGHDAAAKAAILATIAFGQRVTAKDVHREGISQVTAADIAFAARLGYVVKLLAIAERAGDEVAVRVHPTMVPTTHPLAAVRESFNAVFIEGEAVGDVMLYGRGAGGMPSASAVLGDLVDAAHNLRAGAAGRTTVPQPAVIHPFDDVSSQYYLSLEVADRPGVLAAVAGIFGEHEVSIRSMEQEGLGDEARLIFITHTALERSMQATLAALRDLDAVDRVGTLLRVVGQE